MSLPIIIMLSICTCAAVLLTLGRVIGMRRIIRYSVIVDVLFTVLCFVVFAGTLGGTLVAVMSGLIMAITLTAAKSYWNWAYAQGHIKQPLKDPKPAKPVKEPKTIITRDELAEGINSNIHKNVINISKFLKRKAA